MLFSSVSENVGHKHECHNQWERQRRERTHILCSPVLCISFFPRSRITVALKNSHAQWHIHTEWSGARKVKNDLLRNRELCILGKKSSKTCENQKSSKMVKWDNCVDVVLPYISSCNTLQPFMGDVGRIPTETGNSNRVNQSNHLLDWNFR